MEKTYTQRIHYQIVIEGEYSVGNKWDEELYQTPEEAHENVLEYVQDSFNEIVNSSDFKIKLTNLRTEEERN